MPPVAQGCGAFSSVTGVSISLPGRTVVFDYGEVISFSQSAEDGARMVAAAGVPAEQFWEAYQADRDRLDHGLITTTEYWLDIGARCGRQWDLAQAHVMWTLDFRSWTSADPGVVRVLMELVDGGTRIALLSNAAADYGTAFRFSPMGALFEQVFVSAELRLLKPDPAIYAHVAEALGIDPTAMVFVDNREPNVRGAESIGVTGHVFTSPASLRAFLTGLV